MSSSATHIGILAFGAYVPRLRLQRACIAGAHSWFAPGLKSLAAGERALANWDEDSITMAVEAARDSLGDLDRSGIGSVTLASTTMPFSDRQNAGIVKEALNLPDAVATMDIGGSLKAGTTGLLQALQCAPGRPAAQLCVAAERRIALPGSEAELLNGDAAAAFVIGSGRPLVRLLGAHSVSVDFVDHFRSGDLRFDYAWEGRWVREEGHIRLAGTVLKDALASFGIAPEQIAHFIAALPGKGIAEILARARGIKPAAVCDSLVEKIGYAGTAHPLLMLAHALERARPHERILIMGFGQGCDVLLLETTDAIGSAPKRCAVSGWLARRKPEENYLKHLAFTGLLQMDRGMRAELDQKPALSALYRHRKTVLALVGGRCRKTGAVQFPRSQISVAASGADVDTQDDYPLADLPASIVTHTADHLAYTPDPPGYYGLIEFAGGGRMVAEFTDVDSAAIRVSARVRMTFRIKAVDEWRHFTKYFWKAVVD